MSDWSLARTLAAFVAELRTRGVTVSPAESANALVALEHTRFLQPSVFRAVLKTTLAKTPEAAVIFEQAFDAFWAPGAAEPAEEREAAEERDDDPAEPSATAGQTTPQPQRSDDLSAQAPNGPRHGASAAARRMTADLADLDADEQRATEALIRALGQALARRLSRRWRAANRGALDLRASLRQAMAHGGDVTGFKRRHRPRERPRLVVLADVSYSMDAYSRFFLCFVHAFAQVFRSVESLVFATTLSRVTDSLARGRLEDALDRLAVDIDDWAGGTRIASTISDYLARFGDAQLDRNTVVMIVSDGWDTDPPGELERALKRLRARCRALIWLDPLMDHPRYFASALGVQHDSPHIDLCVPARNLAGLEGLVDRLFAERIV